MLTGIMIAMIIIMLGSIYYWSSFIKQEGKDERGQKILGKAGQLVYSVVALGYAILMIFNHYLEFSNDQFTTALTVLIAVIMFSNTFFIGLFRRIY